MRILPAQNVMPQHKQGDEHDNCNATHDTHLNIEPLRVMKSDTIFWLTESLFRPDGGAAIQQPELFCTCPPDAILIAGKPLPLGHDMESDMIS